MFDMLKEEIKRDIKKELIEILLKSYIKDLLNEKLADGGVVRHRVIRIIGGNLNGWFL